MFVCTSANPDTAQTKPEAHSSLANSALADSLYRLMSLSVGAVIPEYVSYKYIRRSAQPNAWRARAIIIALPPFQTPHSTRTPSIPCRVIYSTDLYNM